MTAPPNQPISDEDLWAFDDYNFDHPSWGSLHVVLEDGNYDCAQFCLDYAVKHGDLEGARLAAILLTKSRSQIANLTTRIYKLKNRPLADPKYDPENDRFAVFCTADPPPRRDIPSHFRISPLTPQERRQFFTVLEYTFQHLPWYRPSFFISPLVLMDLPASGKLH